jgi:hypothetical protein
MRQITNISIYSEKDLKSIKKCWLYHIETKESIFIKYIVHYEGTGEVKISLHDDITIVKEIIFKDTQEFYEYISQYSRTSF